MHPDLSAPTDTATPAAPALFRVAWEETATGRTGHGEGKMPEAEARKMARDLNGSHQLAPGFRYFAEPVPATDIETQPGGKYAWARQECRP